MYHDLLLTQVQVCDLFELSRTTVHKLIKDKKIDLVEKQVGAVKRKFLDWNSIKQLLTHIPRLVVKPKNIVKVFGNLKGGTGKSTLCVQFSMLAAAMGLKTLLIDLDPQAHATLAVLRKKSLKYKTILDIVIGDRLPPKEVIQSVTPFLDIIPSNLNLAVGEISLFNELKRAEKIKQFTDSIRDSYDLITFDLSPSAGLISTNALIAADEIICVTETEFYSTDGLVTFFNVIKVLSKDFDITPHRRIIPNFHSSYKKDNQQSLATLRTSPFKNLVTATTIMENTDLKEAHKNGLPIWSFKSKSQGAKDIKQLYKEILD